MDFQLNLDSETVDHAHLANPLVVDRRLQFERFASCCATASEVPLWFALPTGALVGIWTERDAMRVLSADTDLDSAIEQVMVREPVTLSPSDTVGRAISLMASGGYRGLPIVDQQGRPTGVLNVSGILHYLVEHFPEVIYTLPPQPHQSTREREGA